MAKELVAKKMKNNKGESSPSPMGTPNLEENDDDDIEENVIPRTLRPIGRKATKMLSKGGESSQNPIMVDLLQKFQEKQDLVVEEHKKLEMEKIEMTRDHYSKMEIASHKKIEIAHEKMQQENERLVQERERLELAKMRHKEKEKGRERSIMGINLNDPTLNDAQKIFFKHEQEEIAKKYMI